MTDIEQALKLLTSKTWPNIVKKSQRGDLDALYLQGVAYLCGGPVQIDISKSYSYFKQAALKGHSDAAFRTGVLLKDYDWPEKPDEDPFIYFTKAADLGSPAGYVAAGNKFTFALIDNDRWWHKFLTPSSVSQAGDESITLYAKALSCSYSPAFYFMGLHYLKGWGVKSDQSKALDLFKYGATLEDADCMYMTYMLLHKYNMDEAISFLLSAADKGHVDSQYRYSIYILDHKDHALTAENALSWLRRAAMQRHPAAMARLSSLLYSGRGVPINYREAYLWAYRAQQLGFESKTLLSNIWRSMSEDDKLFVQSHSFELKNKDFFSLSNKLFGTGKFTLD